MAVITLPVILSLLFTSRARTLCQICQQVRRERREGRVEGEDHCFTAITAEIGIKSYLMRHVVQPSSVCRAAFSLRSVACLAPSEDPFQPAVCLVAAID